MSTIDKDNLILDELKAQNIDGLTDRGKFAICELAEMNEGAVIFLFLSLNSRIRDLEVALSKKNNNEIIH